MSKRLTTLTMFRAILPAAFGIACLLGASRVLGQPCPSLGQNATFTSSSCRPGLTPCTLCPGDEFTLRATGTGLQPGVCVNWYYGTTPNFNPYNGQGTLLGCSKVRAKPPNSCGSCPRILALFVNACGTEQNNEMMAIWSGSGFYVDDATLTFPNNSAGDADIGVGCSWQQPSANAIASIQSICSNAVVVGAGPGDVVPPGVPVVIFTSAAYDYNYNFGSLCPLSPVIYVMQNGCTRNGEAFPNSGGSQTVTFGLTCGCSWSTTYNTAQLVGGDGAFVTDAGFPNFYGNAGCGFPSIPGGGGGGGGGSPIEIPPYTATVTQDMCNKGPFWVVGIVEPLPPGCNQTFTNYMAFNVICPQPNLGVADVCQNGGPFDLTKIQDPAVPNGTWSGQNVNGSFFNPSGLLGPQVLTFTTALCNIASQTTVTVHSPPSASISPIPTVCPGRSVQLVVNFTGQPGWLFNLQAGNNTIGSFAVNEPKWVFPIFPTATTTYTIQGLEDAFCKGPNASALAVVMGAPSCTLTRIGPDTICAGQRDTLRVQFSTSNPPYSFVYSINGVNQPAINTNNNPHTFLTPPLPAGRHIFQLESVMADSCIGIPSGRDTVFARPAPRATFLNDTLNLCVGQRDTLRIKLRGLPPFRLQYSVRTDTMKADTLPLITTTDTLLRIPITPPLGTTVYRIFFVGDSLCESTVGDTLVALVGNPPSATLSGNATICAGDSTNLRFTFTGTPPFVFTYAINGVAQPPDTAFSSPKILRVSPDSTSTYTLTSVRSNGCTGTVSGSATVTVSPPLTATISGGGQICQGGSGTTITITFTGTGPYTVVYRANGNPQPAINTNSNPLVIPVNPPNGVFYTLQSVSNASGCPGTVDGVAVVAVFTPSTAELKGDITVCENADTSLVVDFTGSGPFLLEYSINGVVQPVVETFDDPYLIPVKVNSTTVYRLVSVESPGCIGSVSGQSTVFVNYPPTIENLLILCNLVDQTYTVQFDALGKPPFSVTGAGGSFVGNRFTSVPIPINAPYDLRLSDANKCTPLAIQGLSQCFCLTNAGDIDTAAITACVGDTLSGAFLGFEELEAEDSLIFVLHTSPTDSLGTIIAVAPEPTFVFNPATMSINTTYYLSPVAGNKGGPLGVLLSDPCLSVKKGAPVVWRAKPTAAISGNFDLCVGGTALIPVALTGTPPFNLTYTLNGQPQTATATQNSFTISATLQQNATFQLMSVSNAECSGTASGTANVTVHPPVVLDNVTVTCAPDNLTFVLELDVVQGDLPFVLFTGLLGGSYNPVTGRYISAPTPPPVNYLITARDRWQCGTDTVSGTATCPCVTDAGSMTQPLLTPCAGESVSVPPTVGAKLGPIDTLLYALVTTNSPTTWTILALSNTPSFAFNPGTMSPGIPYYIFALAGIPNPATGIDLNHPCASVSPGATIIWQPRPTVSLTGDASLCAGDSTTLRFTFTGVPPFTATYQIGGVNQPPINTNNTLFTLVVKPSATTTYSLVSATGNGCPADISGGATVTINPLPVIQNLSTNCNPATLTYTVTFNVAGVSNPTVSGLNGSFVGNTFTSAPLNSGQAYSLVVSSPAGCTATATGSATCNCITNAGTIPTQPLNVCLPDSARTANAVNTTLAPGEILQYILYQNPATLPAGILAVSSTPVFGFQPGMQAGTTYYISAVAGLPSPSGAVDPLSPCLSVSPPVPVVFRNRPTATISGDTTVCTNSNALFQVRFTGTAPFQFVYRINGVPQNAVSAPQNVFTISSNNVQQPQLFELVSVQDQFCTGTVSGTYRIRVQDGPTAAINAAPAALCTGDSATLTLTLTGGTAYNVTLTGGADPISLNNIQSGATVRVSPSTTTTYIISTLVAQGNQCPQKIGPGATVRVSPPIALNAKLSDYGNGHNISCSGEADGFIALQLSGGIPPISVQWSNGAQGPDLKNVGAGTYVATVRDSLGCSRRDSFTLSEPPRTEILTRVEPPRCFGERNGRILITSIQGGLGPYAVGLNNGPTRVISTLPVIFPDLGSDNYTVKVLDANGCDSELGLIMPDPPQLVVVLGPDTTLYLGDSVRLEALVAGPPIAAFSWTPTLGLNPPNSLTTFAKPSRTTRYTVEVRDTAGCVARDEIVVNVLREPRIYIPNVFQPGSSANGAFFVSAGPEVINIRSMRIYDRWGNCVFEKFDVKPNNPALGWDGRWRGQNAAPGVYAYAIELEYSDGTTEIKAGDITIAR
ncbi:MAG: gliding motility-associated C-terminal domain-containing protein [Saprospiraceae bacterium]|nr:gliding motility-associated C-terminal domain-containing protein [Saprospiraceae bacterium]MDW8229160.1 gliding motility-associated C-terminal domain-containing protein [Saprospiraceae bacterium]